MCFRPLTGMVHMESKFNEYMMSFRPLTGMVQLDFGVVFCQSVFSPPYGDGTRGKQYEVGKT